MTTVLDDAERSVIGAVFLRNDSVTRVHLRPDDFYDRRLALIWTGVLELHLAGKPIDSVTLGDQLNGRSRAIDWLLLSECISAVPTADNVEYYAAIVLADSRHRRLRTSLSELAGNERLDLDERLARAKTIIGELEAPVAGSTSPVAGYGQDAVSFLGDEDDVDDDSQDWVVRGLILRAAPNVIAGMPKSKKTLIALHLCLAVAAGEANWLGRFPITPGRVLILAHEDSKRETRRRIWRLARGMGYDPRSLGDTLRIADRSQPFHFDRQGEMDRMERTVSDWKPRIVLMDSLSRMHMGDENSKQDMNVVTDAWLTLAARYDLAIVTIHHLVKVSDSQNLITQLRGSGDIGAAMRHAVGVRRDKEDSDRLRLWTEGNSAYQPEPFEVQVSDDADLAGKPTILLSEASGGSSSSLAVEAAIMLCLASGSASSRQLRTVCKGIEGCRNQTVDEVARRLELAGRIRRIGGGPWKVI